MTSEYRLNTVKDFLAVPAESIDACLSDFKTWLEIARNSSEFNSDMNELLGIPGAVAFSNDGFTWLDDGISGISLLDIMQGDQPIARISIQDLK
jgi:hypothetical protein